MTSAMSMSFGKWMSMALAFYAPGLAIVFWLVTVDADIAPAKLLLPYAAVLCPFLGFAVVIYWSRMVLDQPNKAALRFATGFCLSAVLLLLGVAYSLVAIGFIPLQPVLEYPLPVGLFSPVAWIVVYLVARRHYEEMRSSRQEGDVCTR